MGSQKEARRGGRVTTYPPGAEPRRLRPWEEARGPFDELQDVAGCLLARIGPVTVALPDELRDRLQGLTGRVIAILRTDNDYRLRVIDGQ